MDIRKLVSMLVVSSALYTSSVLAEEEELKCDDWTLSSTFQWAGCKWDQKVVSDGGYLDQQVVKAKAAAKDKAISYAKNLALSQIAQNVPYVGQLISMWTGQNGGGPSEVQLALEKILDAIKISEARILEGVNQIFITRDFASLESFKERVRAYHIDSPQVRKANIVVLQHLWQTSVELKHFFETHTQQLGVGKTISSFHAYLSIVSLELMLRTELSTLNYMGTSEENNLPKILTEHYVNELIGVFDYVEATDWNKGAESLFDFYHIVEAFPSGGTLGGCRVHFEIEFSYDNQNYGVATECSNETKKCQTRLYKGDWTKFGFHETSFNWTSRVANTSCQKNSALAINDHTSPFRYSNIIKSAIQRVENDMVSDAYGLTPTILDSWWGLAGMPGDRIENPGDKTLEGVNADVTTIENRDGRCLETLSSDFDLAKNGAKVQMWDCYYGKNQSWRLTEDGQIRTSNGTCLSVDAVDYFAGIDNGKINAWTCLGLENQKWYRFGEHIRSYSGKCLAVNTQNSISNGSLLSLSACSNTKVKKIWSVQSSLVRLRNYWKNNLYLHNERGNLEISAAEQWWWSAMWVIEDLGTPLIRIKNRWTNKYLYAENGIAKLGTLAPGSTKYIWILEDHKMRIPDEISIESHPSVHRIKNSYTRSYLHIENGRLELSPTVNGWHSAYWITSFVN